MTLNNVIKWSATVVTIAGAIAVAQGIDPLNIYLLNIGSLLWVWWAIRIREASIIVVNIALLAIYVWGIVVRL